MARRAWLSLFAAVTLSACGEPPPVADSGADAARGDAARIACAANVECDDLDACNGPERCLPGDPDADAFGCVAGAPLCMPGQDCDPTTMRCTTICAVTRDADADGADAIECLGDDCDDADPLRRPGLLEVCDDLDRDEDCDGATFGARDADGDLAVDAACCNGTGATLRCGTDCNDASRLERPSGSESCDGRDQDCDGTVDEGVTEALSIDADRDLHGDDVATAPACRGAVGVAASADDCDDDDPGVHRAQLEIRDALDNDCDGTVDEDVRDVTFYRDVDGDGFGAASSGVVRSDAPVAGYVILGSDCDDARADVSPLAREQCNGRDDDCNGAADFPLAPGDYEDDDHDGHVDLRCPLGDDCADADPTIHPAAIELCDDRDNDCDARADEDVAEATWWLDRDGDGFGDASSPPLVTCELVSGRVLLGGDCDDDDRDARPGRLDDCARPDVDDDCDAQLDEAGALLPSYRDADGDGTGAGAPALSCTISAGRAEADGDCDDAAALRSPALVEDCASAIDDDCDALVDCEDDACTGRIECVTSFDLAIASGDAQTALVAEALAAPVRVCVTSAGAPIVGRVVTARPSEGLAVSPAMAATGSDGCGSFAVTLGRMAGPASVSFVSARAPTVVAGLTANAAASATVYTVANRVRASGTASEGAASASAFVSIADVVADASGVLYVADEGGHAVYRISPRGALTRLAGTGSTTGPLGDGAEATFARLRSPVGLALDGSRLFVADRDDQRVRVIDLASGRVDTFAGTGSAVGDRTLGIPGHAFALSQPRAVAVAEDGTVWIGDDDAARPFSPSGAALAGAIVGACASCPAGATCAAPPRCALAIGPGELLYSRASVPVGACRASDGLAYAILRGSGGAFVAGCRADGTGVASRVADLALDGARSVIVADADGAVLRVDRASGRTSRIAGGSAPGEHVAAASAAIAPIAIASTTAELAWVDGAAIRVAPGLDRATDDGLVLQAVSSTSLGATITRPVSLAVDAVDASGAAASAVALEIDAGALGRWIGGATDAGGRANLVVRSWLVPRTFDANVRAHDIHGAAIASLRFTITVSPPAAGTVLTLVGDGSVRAMDLLASMSDLPALAEVVAAAQAPPARALLGADGSLVLPGVRIDPSGVARAGIPYVATGPLPEYVALDGSGGLFVRTQTADSPPVDALYHQAVGAAARVRLDSYVDRLDALSIVDDARAPYEPLWSTRDGRLFEAFYELHTSTGAVIGGTRIPYPAGAGDPYTYAYVDPYAGAQLWISPLFSARITTVDGIPLVDGAGAYIAGARPLDVPLRGLPSLASTPTPGVILLASREAGVPCSGAILRLEFASATFANGEGTSSILAGSPSAVTSDRGDEIAGPAACLDEPVLVGVDSLGHAYFLDTTPPRLRVVW